MIEKNIQNEIFIKIIDIKNTLSIVFTYLGYLNIFATKIFTK